jgi:hypothetical protein
MKVMVDAGGILHSRFAKTVCGGGLFRSVFKGSALKVRIPSIAPTTSESSMDGDRERHGLFRARPPSGEVSAPQRISIPQITPMFYDAACEVHHEHFSPITDRRVKRPKIDVELTGPVLLGW